MLVKLTLVDDNTALWVNPRHVASVTTVVPDEDKHEEVETLVSLASGSDYSVFETVDTVVNALNAAEVH